ncbi:NUDIX domain-containing protein [Pontibacillus yanchengensis]|uniref:NUDIX domain-containing protein n=2 Tax=Pontibacillus yanchengensis TaxID=462910 RepID=A0A6I4ZXQ5_9BACI|nr:NUDIX domain-containing protein [Pontibacillus yanchengensis]
MNMETLKVFNEHRQETGVASREEVHQKGLWHETFQCWFVSVEDGKPYVYLQKRSSTKQDFPNLFDITAAGHLLSHETLQDGVREVEEELGLYVSFDELYSGGIKIDPVTLGNFVDREFAHVFIYFCEKDIHDFTLQQEEVSGMIKVELSEFNQLWEEKVDQIRITGFVVDEEGKAEELDESVGRDAFVPHSKEYYQEIVQDMYDCLEEKWK